MKLWPLESIRGLAAVYVVIHHAKIFDRGGLGNLFYFGQEAVIIFFLLSGFVIEYSVSRRQTTVAEYFFARLIRIYPLFLTALLAAYLSDSVLQHQFLQPNWTQLLGNVLMLQDVSALKPGVWFDTFAGNSPLWSLSYEWWFYLAYIPLALVYRGSGNQKLWAVAVVSLTGYIGFNLQPAQPFLFMNYLLIWWMGTSIAQEFRKYGAVTFSGQRMPMLLIAAMAGLWAAKTLWTKQHGEALGFGIYPILQLRHFAAALVIVVIGILWSKCSYMGATVILRPFAKIGSISYAVYVLHQPALNMASSISPSSGAFTKFAMVCLVLFPLAYVAECLVQPKLTAWLRDLKSYSATAGRRVNPPLRELADGDEDGVFHRGNRV